MATGQTQVSSDTIEKTKQQIRGLVGEISQLAKSDLAPEEFYSAFLQRVVQALAAVGGAVWTLGEGKRPQLAYQINLSDKLLDIESEDAQKHFRLLDYIIASNNGTLVPPLSGAGDERMGGNPTRQLLVIQPLGHDQQVEGLIEIFQRPDTQPATQRGYLTFLQQMCALASEWFKNRQLRQFSDRHSLWSQADQFARVVHESLETRTTAYTIANEGRRLLGCDRVSIALMKGKNCYIESVSGQDTMDNRSNVVTLLGKLATRVVASGEPLWYAGTTEDMPPQIEQAIEDYVDQSYTKSLGVIPLRKPNPDESAAQPSGEAGESDAAHTGEIIGALIIEQIESDIPREILAPRLDLVYEHSSRALANAIDHNSLFLMPVWRALGQASWVVQARTLPKTIAITVLVVALLVASVVVPWDFDMRAKGALQPVNRREVYVPEDNSRVVNVLVDNGAVVKPGDPLIELENDTITLQLTQVDGELAASQEELAALRQRLTDAKMQYTVQERERDQAQFARVSVQVTSLKKRLDILKHRQEGLIVRSPIAGRVVTWDAKKNLLGRPVGIGQSLLTVAADDTDWELELQMPERRVKHLVSYREKMKRNDPNADLKVDYILMTDPGTYHQGIVTDVHGTAEPNEEKGNMVRIKVKTLDKVDNPRPGATVTADVHCGKAPIIVSVLHEAWEWIEANVLF
jgi:biotin carboxyl carrier protein